MRRIIAILSAVALATACNTEKQALEPTSAPSANAVSTSHTTGRLTGKLDMLSMTRLSKIGLVSDLKVSLQTVNGDIVQQTSALQPNTTYRINVSGKGATKVQIRACFGFDLLEEIEQKSASLISANYLIKTHSDVLEPLMVSIIPLRSVGSSLYREQAQMFQLTSQSGQ